MLEYCGTDLILYQLLQKKMYTTHVKNVRLAKQMSNYEEPEGTLDALNKENKIGVECKLNYAMASGEQKNHFYCLTYIKYMLISGVWDLHLEFNTKQMMTTIKLNIQLVL